MLLPLLKTSSKRAGKLQRDFKHLAVDLYLFEEEGVKKLRVDCHFGKRKNLAAIRTTTAHVQNMIHGTSKGFLYKMRLVYAHFPINANIEDAGCKIEIRNFLGEKRVRVVNMLPGTLNNSDAPFATDGTACEGLNCLGLFVRVAWHDHCDDTAFCVAAKRSYGRLAVQQHIEGGLSCSEKCKMGHCSARQVVSDLTAALGPKPLHSYGDSSFGSRAPPSCLWMLLKACT